MRNRAKCKLCNEILESFHHYDYVTCKCGEISIDGGTQYYKCSAKNWSNFLRVDDQNNEIIPNVVDEIPPQNAPDEFPPISRKEKLEMLQEMINNLGNLPPEAMTTAITHYDFYAYLLLISSILRE